ncbi:metal ABC transporter permease [Sinobaca sp. H24]|uniref:metal ABC transporter permease n=1 Tax=Sinobaca sp. H24 TaxID=2923376 RepID=UPI00207A2B14|nr:metal ABC transporter permease [Sinobaca sp. H24]
MQEWLQFLSSPNLQWVMAGAALLGLASGVVGSFVLLRKESLVGDAMAHAALPGICLGFLVFGRETLALMGGAALTGLLAVYAIRAVHSQSKIKQDAAIGIVLSVFFGFGIVLLTMITNGSYSQSSGLDEFIFGQAASLVGADVQILIASALILLILSFLFFKELKLLIFDPLFAGGIGLPIRFLNALLSSMVVLVVITGIQTVGVILMAALLITPAVTARYWTDRLGVMAVLSGLIGGLSGAVGALLSSTISGLPTGPVIVVTATAFFLISFLFAPQRGILFRMMETRKNTQLVLNDFLLDTMYEKLEKRYASGQYSALFSHRELEEQTRLPRNGLEKTIQSLQKQGLLTRKDGKYVLTGKGLAYAYDSSLLRRLQDIHLTHEAELGSWKEASANGDLRKPRDYLMNERIHSLLTAEQKLPISLAIKQTSIEYADQA